MAVTAVVFDVGETLVDETRMWERAADTAHVPRFTLMGILGGLAARREHHGRVWELLGVDQAPSSWDGGDFYPDALPCLERLRAHGYSVAAVGNTPQATEELLALHVDVLGSSERWGVSKPAPEFFDRILESLGCPPAGVAYVGDRVDNDVEPALRAGMTAVHVRRGPWGHLHEPPPEAIPIRSLDELPAALP
jgi:HAD superfamily hydrolase (TIGR01509 family)